MLILSAALAGAALAWTIRGVVDRAELTRVIRQSADLRAQVAEMLAQMRAAGVEYRPWQ